MDEDTVAPTWYPDLDRDGWGDSSGVPMMVCAPPPPSDRWAQLQGDCDDSRAQVHPGAREDPLTPWDDDCDGQVNETFELRSGIESLGGSVRSGAHRIVQPRIESTTSRVCSATGRCLTGGVVSGDLHPGGGS